MSGKKKLSDLLTAANVISDKDLSAFAAMHDMLNAAGVAWRLTAMTGAYHVEVKWPASLDMPQGADIAVDGSTLSDVVKNLGEEMMGKATLGERPS